MVFKHLIGGKEVPASDGMLLDVVSPVDGALIAKIASGTAQDVDTAVKAARTALEGSWGKLTATERGRLLMKLATIVEAHADELAALESRDNGKPLRQSRADAIALARYFEFYGSAADKLHGDVIPYLNTHFIGVERVPHGVTGHIVPWNYPMQIFGRSVGAALAAGNATVVKPAEDASLTILRVSQFAREAGFPDGALNIVTGLGRTAGAALSAHPGIDFLSFTGSPETGTAVQTAAAQNHVGVTLELGGKSAQVVFDDADIERALPTLVNAIIQNGGQTCSAGSRLLIQRGIFDEVVSAVAERFKTLRAGHPEREPDLGPMINQAQQRRVRSYLERARNEGLQIMGEGVVAIDAPAEGFYVPPVFFAPVPHRSILSQEEVFGPVLVATPFEDEAEAIRFANGTPYGLAAGVWTRDAMRSTRVGRAMRAGQVFVNCYGAGGGIELPFGGFGRSGHGREKGFEGLVEFTTTKTLVIAHG
ncbi:aldehyde dehydrogenase family protein [Microvirga makkahensis]|uniref:Aldehyde dehydrogenase family protein n=2 Tax=Microvirga makkahensis TaxID=1128670 RepID=A0A7X3MT40_9HYPH|nr:aldehyde dehydrogenase family protein [Microvirga makkahensis]MXQ12600.1 aldehyde dehydrogenase family protein [Microvirga makkahensis]